MGHRLILDSVEHGFGVVLVHVLNVTGLDNTPVKMTTVELDAKSMHPLRCTCSSLWDADHYVKEFKCQHSDFAIGIFSLLNKSNKTCVSGCITAWFQPHHTNTASKPLAVAQVSI
jgi:hypothetical protein